MIRKVWGDSPVSKMLVGMEMDVNRIFQSPPWRCGGWEVKCGDIGSQALVMDQHCQGSLASQWNLLIEFQTPEPLSQK